MIINEVTKGKRTFSLWRIGGHFHFALTALHKKIVTLNLQMYYSDRTKTIRQLYVQIRPYS